MTPIPSPLLVVTDRHQAAAPLEQVVAEVVAAGARWVWFRDRDLDLAERRRLARTLGGIVRDAGGWLSVGGDVDLAIETGSTAAHLRDLAALREARRRLGPTSLVGLSAHSLAEVAAAHAAADYVTLSPIYPTASKPGYGPALGPDAVAQAAQTGVPVIALGGIAARNVRDLRERGAAGIAVMGEVMRAARPGAVVEDLLRRLA